MTTDVEKAALYRAMLPQVDEDFLRLLKEELRETLLASRKNWRNYAKLGPSAAKAGKFTVSELAAN